MAARARLTVVPDTQLEGPPDLRGSVKAAVAAMDWLTATDRAMADLALRQAAEIETAVDRANELAEIVRLADGRPDVYRYLDKLVAMCKVTETVIRLGPQLQATLRDLGGTPAARALLKRDKPVGSRLAQLRDAAGKHDS